MEWILVKLNRENLGIVRLKACACGQMLFDFSGLGFDVRGELRAGIAEVAERCACGRVIESDYFIEGPAQVLAA